MLSEITEKALRELSEVDSADGVVISRGNLAQLLGEIDALRYDIVRTQQDADRRQYGAVSTWLGDKPARPPVLDDLTAAAAITVDLDTLVDAVSTMRVRQVAALVSPAQEFASSPWFTPAGAA